MGFFLLLFFVKPHTHTLSLSLSLSLCAGKRYSRHIHSVASLSLSLSTWACVSNSTLMMKMWEARNGMSCMYVYRWMMKKREKRACLYVCTTNDYVRSEARQYDTYTVNKIMWTKYLVWRYLGLGGSCKLGAALVFIMYKYVICIIFNLIFLWGFLFKKQKKKGKGLLSYGGFCPARQQLMCVTHWDHIIISLH